MKRLIWLPLAGFLLIAGAAVATAAPSVVGRLQGVITQAAASPDPSANPGTAPVLRADKDGLLSEVLTDLVANNTITQAQADAITRALTDKMDAKRAEMDALRQQWESFVADGVITQDEIDQLPADSPFRGVWDSIAQDGQVTLDQLRQFGPLGGHGPGHGPGGFGFRFHGEFGQPDDSEQVPDATPTPGS